MEQDDEWEYSKENVQPRKQGRDFRCMMAALSTPEPNKYVEQQRAFEMELRTCDNTEDPLDAWYRYINWIEQNFPKGGKKTNIDQLIQSCVQHFSSEERYKNDVRMIRIWIKLTELSDRPLEIFNLMNREGIGCEVAEFYIAWSGEYENVANVKQANQILQEGVKFRAEPADMMQSAVGEFQMRQGRLMLSQMTGDSGTGQEGAQRAALNSMTGTRNKAVRVASNPQARKAPQLGDSVKKGIDFKQERQFQIFSESGGHQSTLSKQDASGRGTIAGDQDVHKENTINPGPWNRTKLRQKTSAVLSTPVQPTSFSVHEDAGPSVECNSTKKPLSWSTSKVLQDHPVERPRDAKIIRQLSVPPEEAGYKAMYDRHLVFAGTSEMSFEQIRAAKYMAHLDQTTPAPRRPSQEMETESMIPQPVFSSSGSSVQSRTRESNVEHLTSSGSGSMRSLRLEYDTPGTGDLVPESFPEQPAPSGVPQEPQGTSGVPQEQPAFIYSKLFAEMANSMDSSAQRNRSALHTVRKEDGGGFQLSGVGRTPQTDELTTPAGYPKQFDPPKESAGITSSCGRGIASKTGPRADSVATFGAETRQGVAGRGGSESKPWNVGGTGVRYQPLAGDANTSDLYKSLDVANASALPSPTMNTREAQTFFAQVFNDTLSTTDWPQEGGGDLSLLQSSAISRNVAPFNEPANAPRAVNIGPQISVFQDEATAPVVRRQPGVPKLTKPFVFEDQGVRHTPLGLSKENLPVGDGVDQENLFPVDNSCTAIYNRLLNDTTAPVNDKLKIIASTPSDSLRGGAGASHCPPRLSIIPRDDDDKKLDETIASEPPETTVTEVKTTAETKADGDSSSAFSYQSTPLSPILETSRECSKGSTLSSVASLGAVSLSDRNDICTIPEDQEMDPEVFRECVRKLKVDDGGGNIDPFDPQHVATLLEGVMLHRPLHLYPGYVRVDSAFPKMVMNHTVALGDSVYKIVGLGEEGGSGRVYVAQEIEDYTDITSSNLQSLALNVRSPACRWEFYAVKETARRIGEQGDPYRVVRSLIDVKQGYFYSDASCLVSELTLGGTLLDMVNRYKELNRDDMEVIATVYAIELTYIVESLHRVGVIHGDVRPDSFLLADVRNIERWGRGVGGRGVDGCLNLVKLTGFGRSVDTTLYPPGTTFAGDANAPGFRCGEMRTGRPWTFQPDLYGLAATVHCVLFLDHMKTQKDPITGRSRIAARLKRRWNKDVWNRFFDTLLNVPSCGDIPSLSDLRNMLLEYLQVESARYDSCTSISEHAGIAVPQ